MYIVRVRTLSNLQFIDDGQADGVIEEFVQCGNFRGSKKRGRKFLRIYTKRDLQGYARVIKRSILTGRKGAAFYFEIYYIQRETPNITRDESIPVPFVPGIYI